MYHLFAQFYFHCLNFPLNFAVNESLMSTKQKNGGTKIKIGCWRGTVCIKQAVLKLDHPLLNQPWKKPMRQDSPLKPSFITRKKWISYNGSSSMILFVGDASPLQKKLGKNPFLRKSCRRISHFAITWELHISVGGEEWLMILLL